MLIIAKKSEKDYYDGVVGTMGIDKTIVYDREIIELEYPKMPKYFKRKNIFGFRSHDDSPFVKIGYYGIKKEFYKKYQHSAYFIIGFCGKLYVGWKLYYEVKNIKYPFFKELITEITYDFDFMKTILDKGYGNNLEDSTNYVKTYNAIQLFRDLKAPVFVYDTDFKRTSLERYGYKNYEKFFINPLLKNYEFYKVFDAFQAFQEISMFMGGVLGRGEKEIVEVQDKYKITQHGFDYKWSFRKEPEKK
jgi:hypothetical protein